MAVPSTNILGVRVDLVDLPQTLQLIENFIDSGRPHQIVVVNVSKIVRAQYDDFLKKIINDADLVGADGVPVVWMSKLFKPEIPGRVNGTDLMEALVAAAAQKGYSVYFFGAEDDVINKVVAFYSKKYPTLKIAGARNGYFSEDEEIDIVKQIRKSNADIMFVGFGSPKKEIFINKYKYQMNVPVIHGVGGSFDVVAGKTKRAPVWMQKYGLEWFFRILQEPKRMLKRYLITNFLFIIFVIMKMLGIKKFE
mgnify:CR=1 FL=1